MKEKLKKLGWILLAVYFSAIMGFFAFFILKEPTITGVVIYEEAINALNWTFDNINDYAYNNSLINLSNGEAKLVESIVKSILSVDNPIDAYITSAIEYEPGKKMHDRTNKAQTLDNDSIDINKDKEIFDITFNEELDNNDVILMYILKSDDNENINIDVYLCDNGTLCDKPGYGLVNFNGNEGWYNITLAGLNSTKNAFNIDPSKNIKFDYIKAVHKETVMYNSTNISYPESASIETNDFDITGLSSFLNFYKNDLLNEQGISYYYSTDSGANWYSVPDDGNLTGIGTANKKIRIKAEFSSDGSATPTIYDFSVEYETKICSENWNLTYGECLGSNTKLKYYVDKNDCGTSNNLPVDNGTYESCVYAAPCNENWNVTYGECLNNNAKLKYYIDKNECGTVNDLPTDNGTYETCNYVPPCNESWNATYGTCLSSNTRLKYYVDKNNCGTIDNLPAGNGTYEACDYCSPSWSCAGYEECQLDNFKKCIAVADSNFCYNLTNLSSDAYSGNYSEFILSCVYNKTGAGFSNLSISAVANEKLIINKANSTDTILELNASNNIENSFISIMKYSENKKNTTPSLSALNKYLDIEANNSLKNSINSIKIKIYYADEEINNANLDEDTLKIYYYNETSGQWQALNSAVNSSGNYAEVTLGHLSTFGIFGQEKASTASESSGSSTSSGSSGGGSTRIIPKTAAELIQTEIKTENPLMKEKPTEKIETPKAKEECNYKISVAMPEHISFVEYDSIKGIATNIGNCRIESLNIDISAGLKDIISIENKKFEGIGVNESIGFSLIKRLEKSNASSLIQGFNIKIPRLSVETHSGSLTFNGLVEDQLAFEEKVNVKVDLLKPAFTLDITKAKALIPPAIILLFLSLFYAYYEIYYKKKK